MILWHTATALFGFRWVFRDPLVDVRWLVTGALAPDVVDILIGALIWVRYFSSSEVFAHSLPVTAVVGVAVLLLTDRSSVARRNLMVMMVGWLFHLLADGIWLQSRVFWWPFAGWEFPSYDLPFWKGAWVRAGSDPWRWVLEGIGLAYLSVVLRRGDLFTPHGFRRFLRSGVLS
jgi:hypothetical protein